MQIPTILHGPYGQARKLCAKAIRSFLSGQPWNGAIVGSAMLDTALVDAESLLVLNGPAPLLAAEPHFQMYLPLTILLEEARKGRVDPIQRDSAVLASLSTPWGILGVLAPKNQMVVYPPALHRPILRAVVAWWDVLDAAGPRYTVGLREGNRLGNTITNLQYVMGQLGIDVATLRSLPEQGLRAIIPKNLLE